MGEIGWIKTYGGQSGGNWVRRQIVQGLSDEYSFEEVVIQPELDPGTFARSAWRLASHTSEDVDVWVEDVTSLAVKLPFRRRNDVLAFHHLPTVNDYRSVSSVLNALRNGLVLRRLRKVDRIVVVSDFWEEFLAERGVEDNVTKVYNGLPVSEFEFDPDEIAAVRDELCDDPDRPLVHVGPCAPQKGGRKAYEALSEWDAELITTGRKAYDVPIAHYNRPYEEYLKILAACDVLVAMSEFPEGWGLQVQEAMLCRTPVVGSGRGGMGTLLDGGDQLTCQEFDALESTVAEAIAEQDRLGRDGYEFARQFTLDRMVDGWRSVFDEVSESA